MRAHLYFRPSQTPTHTHTHKLALPYSPLNQIDLSIEFIMTVLCSHLNIWKNNSHLEFAAQYDIMNKKDREVANGAGIECTLLPPTSYHICRLNACTGLIIPSHLSRRRNFSCCLPERAFSCNDSNSLICIYASQHLLLPEAIQVN